MKKIICTLITIVGLFFYSCGDTSSQREDFEIFYKKFFTDSAFQMERIVFPLKSCITTEMGLDEDMEYFYWNKDDWMFLSEVDTKYSENRFEKSDTFIREVIYPISNEYGNHTVDILKYAKRKNKWYLIDYFYASYHAKRVE